MTIKKVLILSVSEVYFFACRRGWEWHYLQWNNTITNNLAGWPRYESGISILSKPFAQFIFNGTKCISNQYHRHFALCVLLELTTESNNATESNGGLISFKQWVTEVGQRGTGQAVISWSSIRNLRLIWFSSPWIRLLSSAVLWPEHDEACIYI